MNLVKIYKDNEIIAKIKNAIYLFHYSDGSLAVKDEDNIEHIYVKEDYDWYYIF